MPHACTNPMNCRNMSNEVLRRTRVQVACPTQTQTIATLMKQTTLVSTASGTECALAHMHAEYASHEDSGESVGDEIGRTNEGACEGTDHANGKSLCQSASAHASVLLEAEWCPIQRNVRVIADAVGQSASDLHDATNGINAFDSCIRTPLAESDQRATMEDAPGTRQGNACMNDACEPCITQESTAFGPHSNCVQQCAANPELQNLSQMKPDGHNLITQVSTLSGEGKGPLFLGQSADVTQEVHEALGSVLEVHTSDALMHFEFIGPFWELTEVCNPFVHVFIRHDLAPCASKLVS